MKIKFILINILFVFSTINNSSNSGEGNNFIQKIIKKFSNKDKEIQKDKQKKKKLLTIVGVDNKEVLNAIHNQLTVEIENPTPTERKFWIDYNITELYKILYAFGYFDAKVEPFNNKTIKKFKITLNTRYKLTKIICNYNYYKEYKNKLTTNQLFTLIGIKQNSYFSTKQLSSGISNLKDYYKKEGFAFVNIDKPEVEINTKIKTVEAIFYIDLGSKTIINDTIIKIQSKKNPKLLEKFIRNRINWRKNDLYNIDTFNNFKENLVKYDLFSTIDIHVEEPNQTNNNFINSNSEKDLIDPSVNDISTEKYIKNNSVINSNFKENLTNSSINNINAEKSIQKKNSNIDSHQDNLDVYNDKIKVNNNTNSIKSNVIVDVKEAPLREILAGVSFNTTDFFGLEFGWKHHNIDGKASNIAFKGKLDKKTPNLEIKNNIYDIFLPRQCLTTKSFVGIEKTTSYELTKFGLDSILWQKITKNLEIGLGGSWDKSKTLDKVPEETKQSDYISTFGIPIGVKFDNTDNLLDPQKGLRFDFTFTPCFTNKSKYNVILGKLSTYIGFKSINDLNNRFVLAIYSKYGTILKFNDIEIPRSKYFFSGGTNSVRGYGTKKIGPLDDKTRRPTGGTSLFEVGIEPRFRLNNNICLTAFIEAGKVFEMVNDKTLFKNLMYGYGVGLIYYTPIAPIRVNLAFPTKRRKKLNGKYLDSFIQIYINVGQAF